MEVEQEFVAAFVPSSRRERWANGLADHRLRVKLLERLWHGDDWDERFATPLRLTGKRPEQIERILLELRSRGAPEQVYVLAVDEDLDAQKMPLADAVDRFSDHGGALLICLPSKLAIHFLEVGPPVLLAR